MNAAATSSHTFPSASCVRGSNASSMAASIFFLSTQRKGFGTSTTTRRSSDVAIVAPATRPSGAAFGCGVAWWPAEEEGVAPSLYTIECSWTADGALSEVKHAWFLQVPEAL